MQFEWLFFSLLKSRTTSKLEATVRQVLMFWKVPTKCSGKHSPCFTHALRCMHYDACTTMLCFGLAVAGKEMKTSVKNPISVQKSQTFGNINNVHSLLLQSN